MAFNLFKKKENKKQAPVTQEAVEVAVESKPTVLAAGGSVLKHFYISEKSARGQAFGQYTFAITDKATKTDVKHAVQRAFNVKVTAVKLIRLPSKQRIIGRYRGTKPGVRKAIVVLSEGQIIAQAQP